MITYNAEEIPLPRLRHRATTAWLRQVAATYGMTVGDVGYLFVCDDRMRQVNNTYLHHDYYTDIITFASNAGTQINGDIFIAPATVQSNAAEYGCSYDEELHRVMVHGLLHLCGCDDKTPSAQQQMRAAEDRALKLLWREQQ